MVGLVDGWEHVPSVYAFQNKGVAGLKTLRIILVACYKQCEAFTNRMTEKKAETVVNLLQYLYVDCCTNFVPSSIHPWVCKSQLPLLRHYQYRLGDKDHWFAKVPMH